MTESQTPRTDALIDNHGNQLILPNDHNATGWSSLDVSAFLDFARQLECELNKSKHDLSVSRRECAELRDLVNRLDAKLVKEIGIGHFSSNNETANPITKATHDAISKS